MPDPFEPDESRSHEGSLGPSCDPRASGIVTACLVAMRDGDKDARAALWSSVYDELRDMAGAMLASERPGHLLQPSALVNEAYVRLLGGQDVCRGSRAYFFSAAAHAMRRILVEHARRAMVRRDCLARTPFVPRALFGEGYEVTADDIDALDRALDDLRTQDARTHEVVLLRFFGGLTIEDVADAIDVSPRTVKRCWEYGRAWLYRRVVTSPACSPTPRERRST